MLRKATLASRVTSSLIVPASPSVGYAMSPILDFRRQKDRRGWQSPADPDADFAVFPNRRHGCIYEVNWEFNSHQVTPSGEAYRNLHLRGLQMLTKGKITSEKAVEFTAPSTSNHKIFYLPSKQSKISGPTISVEAWKLAIRQVRMQLSFQPELFMHDGILGSSRNASVKSRLMFNSSKTALDLHFASLPAPATAPENFNTDIVGWMFEGNNLDFPRELYGIDSDTYTLVDLDRKRFISVGNLNQEVVKASISAVAGDVLAREQQSLLLNKCDSVLEGEQSALLFSATSSSSPSSLNLFSSGSTVWGPNGLSKAWDSVSYDHVPSSGSGGVIEKSGKETKYTTKIANHGQLAPHPKVAIFLSPEGKTPIAKLAKENVASFLTKSHSADFAKHFEELATANGTQCYAINAKTPANLGNLIKQAFTGK